MPKHGPVYKVGDQANVTRHLRRVDLLQCLVNIFLLQTGLRPVECNVFALRTLVHVDVVYDLLVLIYMRDNFGRELLRELVEVANKLFNRKGDRFL